MKQLTALTMLLLLATLAAKATDKPNILWIVTDDQRADSIAAFNRMLQTSENGDSRLGKVLSPNVDRLAQMGTTFINTFNQ
ncbi:MAG: sulfatase-like hydrolase/transferase, partial [Verrucomicrobiales bacterium]